MGDQRMFRIPSLRALRNEEGWVKIHTACNEAELHLIAGILTGEGLECRVKSLRVAQLPVSNGLLGSAEIYVPQADAPLAQRILMVYRNR